MRDWGQPRFWFLRRVFPWRECPGQRHGIQNGALSRRPIIQSGFCWPAAVRAAAGVAEIKQGEEVMAAEADAGTASGMAAVQRRGPRTAPAMERSRVKALEPETVMVRDPKAKGEGIVPIKKGGFFEYSN